MTDEVLRTRPETNTADYRPNHATYPGSDLRAPRPASYDSDVATKATNLVGRNIVHGRKLRGISQDKLAAMLEIRREQLSDWERGEHVPNIINMRRISVALGLPIDWFFDAHEVASTPEP